MGEDLSASSQPGSGPENATTAAASQAASESASAPQVGETERHDEKGASKDKEKEKDSEDRKPKEKNDKNHTTIEDLNLPRSIITRLAKDVLAPNTQIQGSAILALTRSATVFVNYLASHANEHTVNAGRKTIDASHVFQALDDTEFSFLRGPLEAEFAKYTQTKSAKRIDYRQRKKAETSSAAPAATTGDDSHMADVSALSAPDGADDTLTAAPPATATAGDQPPRAKKAKTVPAAAAVAGAAAAAGAGSVDDAETEPEDETAADEHEDDDDDDDGVDAEDEGVGEDEEDEDEENDEAAGTDGDETQDALEDEDQGGRADDDEALDGDESD